jgi:hypothetical protein
LHLLLVFVPDPLEFLATTAALDSLAVLRPLALSHQLIAADVAVPRTLFVVAGFLSADALGGRQQRHSHYRETPSRTDSHLTRRPRIQIHDFQPRKRF